MNSCKHFALKLGNQENAGYVAAWASEARDPFAAHRIAFKINCDHGISAVALLVA